MENIKTGDITVGIVGLGLMGCGFIATLLMAEHNVIAIAPIPGDIAPAPERINNHLKLCEGAGLLDRPIESYLLQLEISEDYAQLATCSLVVECVIEIPGIKKSVYEKIENAVTKETVIASNTSAIPISELQKYLAHPERFIGIHWAEPSYFSRFMEITCGNHSDMQYADWVYELAHRWGKEPTLLRKDLRGFITNRLMYAVYREGLSLVEKGEATLEDVDKAFRYDAGSWMTLMGIFRRMDYIGLKDQLEMFKTIFPELCNDDKVSPLMQEMADTGAEGNRDSFRLYSYSEDEVRQWEEAFDLFNVDIFQLAAMYPSPREKNAHKI
ncbi:MAG: 3-hydroxyacyl-CoA dehydrogenase [Ferruginibacter sp.]|nr:3-hydroxyacyl-CoA dehydrogenase [Ferruginibacter sp.]